MKHCRAVRARLFAAVEGSLAIEETLAVEEHARACPSCAVEMRRVQRMHEAFAQLPEPPLERVDVEAQVARIRAAIDRGEVEHGGPSTPWSTPARHFTHSVVTRGIAAGLLVGAAAWWWLAREAGRSGMIGGREPVAEGGPSRPEPSVDGLRDGSAAAGESTAAVNTSDAQGGNGAVEIRTHELDDDPVEAAAIQVEPPVPSVLEPIDRARLDAARETVRAALVAAAPSIESGGVDAFLAQFDADTVELARENWPIVRLVERVMMEADPAAAAAALPWLGRRGDALSARRLALVLEDPARKQAAALALVELGAHGRDALVSTLLDEQLRDVVLDQLAKRDPAVAAAMLVKATRAPRLLDTSVAMEQIERRRLVAAAPWLEALVRERCARGNLILASAGARALATLGDVDSLHSLVRLRSMARAREAGVDAAIEQVLWNPDNPAARLARDLEAANRGTELRALHDVLLATPDAPIVSALIVVASSRELRPADRRFAILLAGEQGNSEHVAALTDLFRRFEPRDRDLKAAALVAIHALGGAEASAAALAELPQGTRKRALELLDGIGAALRPGTTLLQITRELEPKLGPLQL